MTRIERWLVVLLASAGFIGGRAVALADSPNNPYRVIADRNAFALKDPQPAPVVAPPVTEPKVNITFTGIAKIGKVKRAYMMTADTKQPGRFNYYDLAEGEKLDGIEVIEIDDGKECVKVKNGTDEATLTFASHGLKGPMAPTPGVTTPVAPGIKPGTFPPPVPGVKTASAASSTGPVIVGRNNAAGANTAGTDYAKSFGNTSAPSVPAVQPAANQSGTANTGLRTIPTRSLRTQPVAAPQNPNNLSPEEQLIMMEAQRMKAAERGIPLPPTPGLAPPIPGGDSLGEQ